MKPNGTWKRVDGTEPANGQFSYDADTFTLTLNQAMIVNYQDVTVGGGFTYPGSVIAFSQSADVSLTIEVSQGTSNITGTGGIRVVSKAGDASLSISGPGSLEVKNVSNDSGIVLIGSKNVNLGINSADVTISNVQYYGVQLAAGDACKKYCYDKCRKSDRQRFSCRNLLYAALYQWSFQPDRQWQRHGGYGRQNRGDYKWISR